MFICVLNVEQNIDNWLKHCYKDDVRRYEMTKSICKGKKVLDFGCGYGGYLQLIKNDASIAEGVELGAIERNYLNSRNIKTFEKIELTKKKYDVRTLFHCFEHLTNPDKWLLKFNDFLTNNGLLVIEVPNGNDALLELYKSNQFADFTYWSAHLTLFSLDGLKKLIDQSGKYAIINEGQVQRYSLENTLYWLSNGKPGGQNVYKMMNDCELNKKYEHVLAELGMCDTLFFVIKKK